MNIKNRMFAGALALLLANTPIVLSKGEQLINEPQTVILQSLKTDYKISKDEYFKKYKYKYVNVFGEERWYASYLDEIDGFKRTEEKERISSYVSDDISLDESISDNYAYLYYNQYEGTFRPFYSNEETISQNDDDYIKTIFITEVTNETLRVLNEYNLYRLVDNLSDLSWELKSIEATHKYGYLCYKPIGETEEGLEVKPVIITSIDDVNIDEMNNYLIDDYASHRIKSKDQITDETIIIKKSYCKEK